MDIISAAQDLSSFWGYAALFIVVLINNATIIYPLPFCTVLTFAGGAVGNPLLVGIVAGVAASIGELSAYFVGMGGEKVMKKYINEGEKYYYVKQQFIKYGFWAIPVFAVTPLPFDLIGLTAGALKYDLKKFFLGVMLGKIPRFLIIAFAGYYGLEMIKEFYIF